MPPKQKAKDIKLNINIKNFKGVSRCPICGHRPEEIEWSKDGLRIWCQNEPRSKSVVIFEPIFPEELDLVKVTERLIESWNTYCKNTKERMKADG